MKSYVVFVKDANQPKGWGQWSSHAMGRHWSTVMQGVAAGIQNTQPADQVAVTNDGKDYPANGKNFLLVDCQDDNAAQNLMTVPGVVEVEAVDYSYRAA